MLRQIAILIIATTALASDLRGAAWVSIGPQSYEFTSEVSDTGYIIGVHRTYDELFEQDYVDLYFGLPIGPTAFGVMRTYDHENTETMMRFTYANSWCLEYLQPSVDAMFAFNQNEWRLKANVSLCIFQWWRMSLAPMILWERRGDVTRSGPYITLRVTL